jgi:integrase
MPRTRESKVNRRARGTGTTFFHEARQVWVGRKIVGRRPDGRPLRVEVSHNSQAEMLRLLELACPPDPNRVTVGQWCERWLQSQSTRPRTRAIRRVAVTHHIGPLLGGVALKDLSTDQINKAVETWTKHELAPSTVKTYLAALRTCLEAARDAGLRPDNPAAPVKGPEAAPTELDPFSPAEVRAVIAEASRRPATRILAAMAVLGCRVGEALGLDVEHFDPARGEVKIRRTWHSAGRELGPTKSRRGVRTIAVPAPGLAAVLAAHGGRTKGPLFPSQAGRRAIYALVQKSHRLLLKRLGIRHRGTHQFRHSVATQLLARGVPVGDVAKYLGDTPAAIMETYCHATDCDVSARVAEIYGPIGAVENPKRVA